MKSKIFVPLLLLTFLFAGCQYTPYSQREEILVSKILKSQQTLYLSSRETQTLSGTDILYHDNYTLNSNQQDDILSLELHVGNLTISGYGYDRYLLSDVILDFDEDIRSQEYVYDYQGYIYDEYHDRYRFSTSLSFVADAYSNPHKGVMQIIGVDETLVVSVIDAYHVDIAIYDNYDSYHDRVIHTTWRALGFS